MSNVFHYADGSEGLTPEIFRKYANEGDEYENELHQYWAGLRYRHDRYGEHYDVDETAVCDANLRRTCLICGRTEILPREVDDEQAASEARGVEL